MPNPTRNQLFPFTLRNERGRKELSAAMMKYLARFARTGDPNAPSGAPGEDLPGGEPWSVVPGGPKYIVFDARSDAPAFAMSREELTDQEVMAAARAELPEPLRKRTLQYLEASPLPSGVR